MKPLSLMIPAALIVTATAAAAGEAGGNLPFPPAEMLRRLRDDEFAVVSSAPAGGGVMGAKKVTLRFADGATVEAKWKAAGATGESWNNSPRREIGAYAVQELFLDPPRFIVPPVTARCIPLDEVQAVIDASGKAFESSRCVLGALSAWLENVTVPEHVYDLERFERDPVYAANFADLNLLHYLIDHRDSRANNFLASKDPDHPRLYSIDNGIAFGGVLYNFFTWHFDEIRVPALRRDSVERLRRVAPRDLAGLGVLGQLSLDSDGVLRNVPVGANLDPEGGVRLSADGVQYGLTREEIEAVGERIRKVLARVDAGELRLL